ncbi:hypothetical protein [Halorarius halobius]|uniref:hypothetical protein n=1 Tax=Halorarius halobius TaxID=2962671 RepID=UPI0020CF9E71|nr:hypothetical protein [Halorarius halobius]
MRRSVPALLAVATLLLAGCTVGPGVSSPDQSPTPSPTPTPEGTPVEYDLRTGTLPDGVESVTVTLRVVFVEHPDDLGPCYPEAFTGPYQPSLTPLPTPRGECHRTESTTVELSADGARTLGPFTAPASTDGHAVVVTDATATRADGSTVSDIYGAGGHEALAEPETPAGTYGVAVGLDPADDEADYEFFFVSERTAEAG